MKIETNKLIEKLEVLKDGINENDFSEIGKYLYFTHGKISCYNGRFVFTVNFKRFERDFAIRYSEFNSIIKNIKNKEIEMEISNENLKITTDKINAELSLNEEVLKTFKDLETEKVEFKKLPDNFNEGLNLTQFCVNKNSTDASAFAHVKENKIYSTDKYRISIFKLKSKMSAMLLPFDCINILINLKVDEYGEGEKFIAFKKDDVNVLIIKSTITEMDFNKFEEIYNAKKQKSVKLPEEIKDGLHLTEILTDQKNVFAKEIEFEIKNKKCICKSENEFGKIKFQTNIDTDIEGKFFIHPLFLLEILNTNIEMELFENIAMFRNASFSYFFKIRKEE